MGNALVTATAVAAVAAALGAGHADPALLVVVGCLGVSAAALATYLHRRSSGPPHRGPGCRARFVEVLSGVAVLAVVYAGVGLRAGQDLAGLERTLPDRIDGIAEMGSDPETSRFGTRFELVAQGRRFTATAARGVEGSVAQLRAGDRLAVEAQVRPFDDAPLGWVRSRHLAGRVDVRAAEAVAGTRPWFRVANGVHELLERGAASMDPSHRSLYLGLVVGDDRNQTELTQFHFRASGLTHLLAVSGQNLVFVLAVLAPLSRRLAYRARWALGVAAVVGFVVITRAEPSVLRAATMAVLGLTAAGMGRRVPGIRLVGLAVIGLLVADPMLVHSIGFRLSVAATVGLVLFTRRIEAGLVGPSWLRLPLAVTLAAQLGAVPVMASTFGNVSVVAVPANLLAGPAAGLVMTLGLTSGLLSGVVREEFAWVLQAPVRLGVWWVDRIAAMGAELAVPPSGVLAWGVIVGAALWSVQIWRTRGSTAVGTSMVVAVVPLVVLLRPPIPGDGVDTVLPGDAELSVVCDQWILELGPGSMDEMQAVELLESLWRIGVTRVGAVSIEEDQQAGVSVGRGWPASLVAAELRAPVVAVSGPPRAEGSESSSRDPPREGTGGMACGPTI